MITDLPTKRIEALSQKERQTFLSVLPTRWRRKQLEQNYVTVTLCTTDGPALCASSHAWCCAQRWTLGVINWPMSKRRQSQAFSTTLLVYRTERQRSGHSSRRKHPHFRRCPNFLAAQRRTGRSTSMSSCSIRSVVSIQLRRVTGIHRQTSDDSYNCDSIASRG